MTDVTALLAGIKERATAALDYPGHVTVEQSAADVPRLVAAIEAVEDLAKYLDTLAEGDQHYAALFRAAVVAALEGEGHLHVPGSSAAECPCTECRECIETFRKES